MFKRPRENFEKWEIEWLKKNTFWKIVLDSKKIKEHKKW